MKYDFDEPADVSDTITGAILYLRSGDTEDYDPVIRIEIVGNDVEVQNDVFTYNTPLDEVVKIELCKRTPILDSDFDVIEWVDTEHKVIWENVV